MVTTSCSSTTGMIRHPVLFALRRCRLDWHATRNALDRDILLLQLDLGKFVSLLDPGADHDPTQLHLTFADLELLFGEPDAFGSVILLHRQNILQQTRASKT